MNILITGGLGYAGSVLSEYLSNFYNILIVDKILFNNNQLKKISSKKIKFFKVDILERKKMLHIFQNNTIDVVIHLAAIVGDPASNINPKLTKKINFNGSKYIFKLSSNFQVKKFIFFSTCSNYGFSKESKLLKENSKLRPLSIYAKTKVDFEKFLLNDNSKIQKIILRLSTLYGVSYRMRFDLTVNEFLKKLYYKEKLEIYHKNTYRPYLSLDDLKIIIKKILNYNFKKNKNIFNVGFNKENLSKKNIVEKISKIMSYKSVYSYVDKDHFDKRNYKVDFTKLKKIGINQRFNFNKNIKKMIFFLKKTSKTKSNNKVFYNHK